MSLLGNRGRFTQDKNDFFDNGNYNNNSVISLIGKNPTKLFKINTEKHNTYDIKSKINSLNLNESETDELNNHQEYNKKISKYNNQFKYSSNKKSKFVNKKRKTSVKIIVAMILVELVSLFGIYIFGSIYRYSHLPQAIPFNIKNVENTDITESTLAIMKGYKTVAVFGVDSRTGSVDKGNNADVNLVINLNLGTGDMQLISVYRDLYLSVTDNNLYDKLNAAYRRGGPEQAVKTLNKNFDLNIDSYFAFNWKAVADGIELLGGIDLEITKSEYTYMNAFIHETCIATGIDSKNPAAHYIKKSGMQHLDGVQAVAYGRLRLMDSDFQRVERQKKVISLCLEKAKTLDIPKLRLIIEAVLPQIAYSFDMNEMISLLRIVRTINITESMGCPDVNSVVTMNMGGSGDCVVPLNLERTVVKLHKTLFNVDDYTPSNSVKRYSNRITELRAKYTEENRINESIKESSKLESLNDLIRSGQDSSSKSKRTTASSSNAKSTNPIPVTAPNNLNIVDADAYEEEPEEDSNSTLPNVKTDSENAKPTESRTNQQTPGSNEIIVYDAPGVPRVTTNNSTNSPTTNSPNTNSPTTNSPTTNSPTANSNNSGVVVSGPPGSVNIPETSSQNAQTPIETTAVVPIITPY